MKKTIIILSVMVLLFMVACSKQIVEEPSTTSGFDTHIDSNKAETSLTEKIKSEITEFTENGTSKVKEYLEKTSTTVQSVSQKDTEDVPPYMLTVDLNDLKQIKTAVETMDEAEFTEYMSENFASEVINGMDTIESTKQILNELEETYIAVLDGKEDNVSMLSFYLEKNEIYQLVSFDDKYRMSSSSYTAQSTRQKSLKFVENSSVADSWVAEKEGFSANLYRLENSDYPFLADVLIEDTYIVLKSKSILSFEDFKTYFARLEFVKIGDLLNE